jgi:hypothetical protein
MRFVAVSVFALVLLSGVAQLPVAVRRLSAEISSLNESTAVERELRGARYVGVHTDILVAAKRVVPVDARYVLVVGRHAVSGEELAAVRPFTAYWLFPRVQTDAVDEASWAIFYRATRTGHRLQYARIVRLDEGMSIAQVRP